mmetsp:Transcript_23246/g.57266  ORF Transcript_23246/g.57266 Transcript_23246/m.57266 type:complete len:155 (+) Transcript_23246:130-594(+)|eukprot:CAMPEP_0113628318 /NCGR_PEP_ID=MMETSP0017_2-20120614/14672_1 /TAXON_ID=2856 /ORGANISM="Cylindrotheca closterium" /LENGTH=154 /DNA_ID=CAMNT_0000538617 /DNA_START=118 /DNA_END=582 /DNA_ORIENTATION=+ /assembly_acc=CAM_ASM_000147
MGSDNGAMNGTSCCIPEAIQKDEKKTAISNGFGIPLTMSLHLWVSSPWTVATIAAVAMNLTYIEASIKARGEAKQNYLSTELPVSLSLIGMAIYGYSQEVPELIIAAIFIHGIWDMGKHHCGWGVPFFGWYLNGCAIFDTVYAAVLVMLLRSSS